MMSEKLEAALNEQINFEFYSSNTYLAMAAYCASEDLDGFANFFTVQAQEENFHAMKFFHFMNAKGNRVLIDKLPAPRNEFTSVKDVFEEAYKHEQEVTKRIYNLADVALQEREHATMSFLKWFIDEQIEEEATFSSIVKKLERIGEDGNALYMLDDELGKRTFVVEDASVLK
ncbi:ferritin [Aneurinibacillus uraniidurans]|uniref:ferritin n=1 Tax=Aneurinibacillus uraniidurans TaxID=2966586 RepID=UPI00234AD6E3|nr:ferritin [Aneurinibacillus sp. B1]WCN38823.1 ferritin [Aneurinibacillus sp. B1]